MSHDMTLLLHCDWSLPISVMRTTRGEAVDQSQSPEDGLASESSYTYAGFAIADTARFHAWAPWNPPFTQEPLNDDDDSLPDQLTS